MQTKRFQRAATVPLKAKSSRRLRLGVISIHLKNARIRKITKDGSNMGSRPQRDKMVKIQERVHVERRVSLATNEIHRLPDCYDIMRGL